jgi:hypothetical protein
MKPTTLRVVARHLRRAAKHSVCRAILLVVFSVTGEAPLVFGDTLTFIGRNGDYRYRATSSDNGWDVGDTITLTGLEQVTDARAPGGFTVVFTPYTVTWTCIEARGGKPMLRVESIAGLGDAFYTIQSGDPGAGIIAGPAYVPEPMTLVLFSAGLLLLMAAWRRRSPSAQCCPQPAGLVAGHIGSPPPERGHEAPAAAPARGADQ